MYLNDSMLMPVIIWYMFLCFMKLFLTNLLEQLRGRSWEERKIKKKKKKSSSSFLFNRNFTNIVNWLFYPMGCVVERETHPTPSPTPKPNAMTSLLLNWRSLTYITFLRKKLDLLQPILLIITIHALKQRNGLLDSLQILTFK